MSSIPSLYPYLYLIPSHTLPNSLQGKETSFFRISLDFRTFVSTDNPIPPQYLQREKIFRTDLEVNEIL